MLCYVMLLSPLSHSPELHSIHPAGSLLTLGHNISSAHALASCATARLARVRGHQTVVHAMSSNSHICSLHFLTTFLNGEMRKY